PLSKRIKEVMDTDGRCSDSVEQAEYLGRWLENLTEKFSYEMLLDEIQRDDLGQFEGDLNAHRISWRGRKAQLISWIRRILISQERFIRKFPNERLRRLAVSEAVRVQRFSGISSGNIKKRIGEFQKLKHTARP